MEQKKYVTTQDQQEPVIADYYLRCKVYFDGSHHIAIPPTMQLRGGKRKRVYVDNDFPMDEEKISYSAKTIEPTKTQQFDELFCQHFELPKNERKDVLIELFTQEFNDRAKATAFVEENLSRVLRNAYERWKRMKRKAYLQKWDYFCSFTYDDKKHSEAGFRKSLLNCLRHFASRRGWKYIGAWERGEEGRLHFHCLLKVPEGQMVGELIRVRDYSTTEHKMQNRVQNTFFNETFGRSDFDSIHPRELSQALFYMTKYITKNNEKVIYSRGLPMYFITDIAGEDVATTYGVGDRKLLLLDNFTCYIDGEVIGQCSPEVIEQMPKSN